MQTLPIRLIHRYAHPDNYKRSLVFLSLLSSALLAAAVLIFYLHAHPAASARPRTSVFLDVQYFITIVGLPIGALTLILALHALKGQSVTVDGTGIRFDNGGGWLGALFGKSWAFRWPEIEHVAWQFNQQQPRATRVVLRIGNNTRMVLPWLWLDPNRPPPQLPHSFWLPSRAKFLPILAHTPVVAAIVAHRPDLGLDTADTEGMTGERTGLTGVTPVTGLIAATMASGVLYFIIENYFTLSDFYVNGPPWVWLIGAAIGGGALILAVLRQAEPQRKDSAVYALLFAVAIGFIAYPLSIRINLWTAPQPAISSPYQLGGDYLWHPVIDNKESRTLPTLPIYLRSSRWWRQFGPGDTHRFTVQRGGLGNWLIDMKAVYQEQQDFYHCRGALDCLKGGR